METKQFYAKTLSIAKKINLINQLGGCCSKCRETRHWMLEFHHEGDKDFGISSNRSRRLSFLDKEIKKCICLCSNCHRKEHDKEDETKLTKLKIKMLEYKNTNCCEKCRYSKANKSLDFHHINMANKKFELSSVGSLIPQQETKELSKTIKDELDKCVVLCSNCHREEHYDLQFYEENKEYILEKSKNIKELQPALDKEEVKRLYLSGMKSIDIARQFKASKGTISGILKSFGISADRTIDRELFKKLISQGHTTKEIQEIMNISKTTLYTIIKEFK